MSEEPAWNRMTPLERLAYLEKIAGHPMSEEMRQAAKDAEELRNQDKH